VEPGRRIQPIRNAQMSNLRSLAAILYSAIRFSRAAFLRSPLRSKALINAQKMATNMDTNMDTNMATNRAASMSVSYQQSTPETRTGKLRRCPAQETIKARLPSLTLIGQFSGQRPITSIIRLLAPNQLFPRLLCVADLQCRAYILLRQEFHIGIHPKNCV
jgi:hypothetical protein